MGTCRMEPPARRLFALLAAIALALAVAGCAAPPPTPSSDARKTVDQRKQGELEQMESMGQRNDDNAPIK